MPRISITTLTVDGIGQLSFEGAMAAVYKRAVKDQSPFVEITDSSKTEAGRLNEAVLIPTHRIAMVTEIIKDETVAEQQEREAAKEQMQQQQLLQRQLQQAQRDAQIKQLQEQLESSAQTISSTGEPTASRPPLALMPPSDPDAELPGLDELP